MIPDSEAKQLIMGVVDRIPDPAEVRRRIVENLQERHLLRQLLKLAEAKQADRQGASR